MTRYDIEHALPGDYLVVRRIDDGAKRVLTCDNGNVRRFATKAEAQAALDAHLSAAVEAAR